MTRFRVNIFDKEKIKLEDLKKLNLVKGINWSGDQLQIIIGGEVGKVLDEFKKYEKNLASQQETSKNNFELKSKNALEKRKSFKGKLLAGISGIMTPNISILMAMGLIAALQAVLLQANVINDPENMLKVPSTDL
jgi:phosphotransferase system IIB component